MKIDICNYGVKNTLSNIITMLEFGMESKNKKDKQEALQQAYGYVNALNNIINIYADNNKENVEG